jgi:hypothetical protein
MYPLFNRRDRKILVILEKVNIQQALCSVLPAASGDRGGQKNSRLGKVRYMKHGK